MGTHISRVKSVDLDSWTDEQLQSVLMWGNARANKYWEAKLASGHIPSEAKIENFIRTKYEAKRWVMDGPVPDPSKLDVDGDDDIPLTLVKEKQELQRSASQKSTSNPGAAGPSAVRRAPQQSQLGATTLQQRASSGPPAPLTQQKPEAATAPPGRPQKPADSLLGLDFFAEAQPQPQPRSTSAGPNPGFQGMSRPDLKQSILSLYASNVKPQQTQQQAIGSVNGAHPANVAVPQPQSSFGGLDDAFGGLSFSNTTSPPPQILSEKPNAFAGLGSLQSHRSPPLPSATPGFGGSFFDVHSASQPSKQTHQTNVKPVAAAGGSAGQYSAPPSSVESQPTKTSAMNDLFDFSTPTTTTQPPKPFPSQKTPHSVFNLPPSQLAPKAQPDPAATTSWGGNFDAFGTNDAWSTPLPAQIPSQGTDFGWNSTTSVASPGATQRASSSFSPGAKVPEVSADEEFGGWSSAAPQSPSSKGIETASRPAGFGAASEDLFSNVWE